MNKDIQISNKKCLGCGAYMIYSKKLDKLKCPYTFSRAHCLIVTRDQVEKGINYGVEPLILKDYE